MRRPPLGRDRGLDSTASFGNPREHCVEPRPPRLSSSSSSRCAIRHQPRSSVLVVGHELEHASADLDVVARACAASERACDRPFLLEPRLQPRHLARRRRDRSPSPSARRCDRGPPRRRRRCAGDRETRAARAKDHGRRRRSGSAAAASSASSDRDVRAARSIPSPRHRPRRPRASSPSGRPPPRQASSTRSAFVPTTTAGRAASARVVGGELGSQGRKVGGRIVRAQIHHQHQRAAPNHVAQEPVPEPLAGGRALDQPGHVGDDEAVGVVAGDAEVRASAS